MWLFMGIVGISRSVQGQACNPESHSPKYCNSLFICSGNTVHADSIPGTVLGTGNVTVNKANNKVDTFMEFTFWWTRQRHSPCNQ